MSAAANTLWARCFVDELGRHGVREVVVAPGSRSTPLVMALASDERFRVRVHLDERSAAFFALGVGKASGQPAAVVTTSGTAAANLLPAVVEASQSAAPLLLITADRPPTLRGSDANQAIDQVRLFGTHVRGFHDVAPPVLEAAALRHLRALAGRAVSAAVGPTAGPVHVNFPFAKPLEPVEPPEAFAAAYPLEVHGRPGGEPFVRVSISPRRASEGELEELVALVDSAEGVIVAGPTSQPDRTAPAVLELAARTGYPLLADPLSGARFRDSAGATRVGAYDLFIGDEEVAARLAPSLIVRVGASPTSASLLRWMELHSDSSQVVIDGDQRWKDHGATSTRYLTADAADALARLSPKLAARASAEWIGMWRSANEAAGAALCEEAADPHEGDVLAAVARAVPEGGSLFVSSSMPVRDLDGFGAPRSDRVRVFGNRGASGIDGIVSTAFGVASQVDAPTVCVLGDVALFHDSNGLLWAREADAAVVFVLIDNDGGGIFHMLPIAEHEPHFTRLFATPHGLDFAHAAALHGIELVDAELGALEADLFEAMAAGNSCILRVRTDRVANRARHAQVRDAVVARVRGALATTN